MNIFQRLWAQIQARIRGTHSVDSALSDVSKSIAKLEATAEHHSNLVDFHAAAEKAAAEAKELAANEEARAQRVVMKFRALVA